MNPETLAFIIGVAVGFFLAIFIEKDPNKNNSDEEKE